MLRQQFWRDRLHEEQRVRSEEREEGREREREKEASVQRADQYSSPRLSGPDGLCLLWTV